MSRLSDIDVTRQMLGLPVTASIQEVERMAQTHEGKRLLDWTPCKGMK